MEKPVRAWLVEDETPEAELIVAHLPEVEFEVRLATMLDAVEHLATRRPGPDVLLANLGLPDSSGLVMLNRLLDAADGIPVIVITADVRALHKAVQIGARGSLPSTNLSGLTKIVDNAVGPSRRSQRGGSRMRSRVPGATHDLLLVLDEDFAPVHVNPAFTSALGWQVADLARRGWRTTVHSDDRDRTTRALRQLTRHEQVVTVEHRLRAADGGYRRLRWRLARDSSSRLIYGVAGVTSVRTVDGDPLREQPRDDELTGLANRTALYHRLSQSIRTERQFAVLFCDLDGFRHINAELGTAVGDRVLQVVADRLNRLMRRRADMVARHRDDEFVLVADRTTASSTAWLVDRALGEVARPITVAGVVVTTTMSIGIAERSPLLPDAGALMTAADEALFMAKRAGRNLSRRWGPDLGQGR